MTPTEAAAWLRHGDPENLLAALLDATAGTVVWQQDLEAIRTLVELAERLEGGDPATENIRRWVARDPAVRISSVAAEMRFWLDRWGSR